MTALTPPPSAAPNLVPTRNPYPVEWAVVDGMTGAYPPETFLWFVFDHPTRRPHFHYAWTHGAPELGDLIDTLAIATSMDAADWLHISERSVQLSHRGRVEIRAYPLRSVLLDVETGVRASGDRREELRRLVDVSVAVNALRYRQPTVTWLGFGPAVVRCHA